MTKKELLNKINELVTNKDVENFEDEYIKFLEDIDKSLDILDNEGNIVEEYEAYKKKAQEEKEEIERSWKEKYKARFFASDNEEMEEVEVIEEKKPKILSYDELFEKE